MDKYEFNLKVEQIKKKVEQKDFQTAMKIADTIDWRRVRNANLLASIADIYETNGEYDEAKDILLLAFERAPVGKRFLYKLAEISVRAGDLKEATEFYHEFREMSPDDSRQYLIQYMILEKKGAGPAQLARVLEQYTSVEIDEKNLYELAKLYAASDQIEKCVETCDRISLLFGLGEYVNDALALKQHFAALTQEQEDLLINHEKYEERLREVEKTYREKEEGEARESSARDAISGESEQRLIDANIPEIFTSEGRREEEHTAVMPRTEEESESGKEVKEESTEPRPKVNLEQYTKNLLLQNAGILDSMKELSAEDKDTAAEKEAEKPEEIMAEPEKYHMIIEGKTVDDAMSIAVDEIKFFHEKYHVNYKVAKISAEKLNQRGFASIQNRLEGRDLVITEAGELSDKILEELEKFMEEDHSASIILIDAIDHFDPMAERHPEFIDRFDIVSDREEEEMEDLDLSDLSSGRTEKEESRQEPSEEAVHEKDTEEKLSDTEEKQDIKQESSLPENDQKEIDEREDAAPMKSEKTEAGEEEPEQPDAAEESFISEEATAEEVPGNAAENNEAEGEAETAETSMAAPELEEDGIEAKEMVTEEDYEDDEGDFREDDRPKNEKPEKEGMSREDFADYAARYAESIDCILTKDGELALYDAASEMEEDGQTLTEDAAKKLVEESADRAENPSLGKKLTAFLHPQYDKKDRLILREEDILP